MPVRFREEVQKVSRSLDQTLSRSFLIVRMRPFEALILNLRRAKFLPVPVHGPVEVFGGGFVDRGGGGGEAGGDVVLEAVLADVAEELLHVGDLDHAGAAEGVERFVGEGAFADVRRSPDIGPGMQRTEYADAMQTVTTDEAMQKLPDLLREVKSRAVVIRDGDQAVGAIVSMEDYQVVRKAQVEQALKAMKDLGNVLRREAEREGLSLEELETMLETHTV